LGIGDWAQSPIPNPQSQNYEIFIIITKKNLLLKKINKKYNKIMKINIMVKLII
jgi:hypothetical protein